MPKYDCEVKDSKGEIIKTTLEAPNLQELANRLSDKGYYLVKAKEVKAGGGFSFGGSVSKKRHDGFHCSAGHTGRSCHTTG